MKSDVSAETRLVNTSANEIDTHFAPPKLGTYAKPNGRNLLWYGIGTDWLSFAMRRLPPHMVRPNNFEVTLDHSRIMRLDTAEQIMSFSREYAVPEEIKPDGDIYYSIDWEHVAKRYAGIEISSSGLDAYFENSPVEGIWLEAWDVPSGVIWDSSAIVNVRKLPDNSLPLDPETRKR